MVRCSRRGKGCAKSLCGDKKRYDKLISTKFRFQTPLIDIAFSKFTPTQRRKRRKSVIQSVGQAGGCFLECFQADNMYESNPESIDHHDGRSATNEETARVAMSERVGRIQKRLPPQLGVGFPGVVSGTSERVVLRPTNPRFGDALNAIESPCSLSAMRSRRSLTGGRATSRFASELIDAGFNVAADAARPFVRSSTHPDPVLAAFVRRAL